MCSMSDGAQVGHDLVLVFEATRRHLGLRAAEGYQPCRGRHVEFF